jgi:hypothetical protein
LYACVPTHKIFTDAVRAGYVVKEPSVHYKDILAKRSPSAKPVTRIQILSASAG